MSNNKCLLSEKALLYIAIIALFCNMIYWAFPFRPIVWRILFVFCSVDVIALRRRQYTRLEKSVLFFTILNCAYFVFSLVYMPPDFGQIGNILVALLSLSFFTHMGQCGCLTKRFLAVVACLLVMGSILQYYYEERMALAELDAENVTVNATSSFLMLIPVLMLTRNDLLKFVGVTTCLLYIIAGAKRGNILAAVLPTLFFVIMLFRGKSRRAVFRTLLLIIIIVVTGVLLYRQFLSNDYLLHRMEQTVEGNSSGRDVIYKHAWAAWENSDSMINIIFGYGFNGTILHPIMNGMYAHNDWLEVLVDYGLLGVIFYLFVFWQFFIVIRQTKEIDGQMVLLSAFFIWLFKTVYSMGFTESNLSILFVAVGAVLGQRQLREGFFS